MLNRIASLCCRRPTGSRQETRVPETGFRHEPTPVATHLRDVLFALEEPRGLFGNLLVAESHMN